MSKGNSNNTTNSISNIDYISNNKRNNIVMLILK